MRRIATIVGLAALSACGDPSPSTFGADFEAALCGWATGCRVFQSEAQCRDALVWEAAGRFDYLEQSAAAGRVRFDPDAASRCLGAIGDLQCDEFALSSIVFEAGLRAAPEACRQVYVGQVRNYDPCLSSEECAGDNAVCGYPPACTDACCVGACRDLGSPPKLGEACTGSCEDEAFCARDPMTFQFTVCEARRKAGESCDDFSDSCEVGLYCDFDAGRCTALLKAGEPCEDARCAEGLQCYRLAGEARCRVLPGEGEACDRNNYPACARFDNRCDETSNACERYPGPGEACLYDGCVPYAECEYAGAEPTCVARAGLGEGCGEVLGPNGEYNYISCLGHLDCGVSQRCEEPEAQETCPLPE